MFGVFYIKVSSCPFNKVWSALILYWYNILVLARTGSIFPVARREKWLGPWCFLYQPISSLGQGKGTLHKEGALFCLESAGESHLQFVYCHGLWGGHFCMWSTPFFYTSLIYIVADTAPFLISLLFPVHFSYLSP